jgi:AcrR family transcriptional regulator
MTDEVLNAERILDATEEVLRRFGPAKATITDVARVLSVSHGAVYRYFSSKALLRDAVIGRWFTREATALTAIATRDSPAGERLRCWFDHLIASKRSKAFDDPELFATYRELAVDAREVVQAHIDGLVEQIAQIIADGVTRGEITTTDPVASAWALFRATALFQYPEHAPTWSDPGIDVAFEGVWSLLMYGLTARTA